MVDRAPVYEERLGHLAEVRHRDLPHRGQRRRRPDGYPFVATLVDAGLLDVALDAGQGRDEVLENRGEQEEPGVRGQRRDDHDDAAHFWPPARWPLAI